MPGAVASVLVAGPAAGLVASYRVFLWHGTAWKPAHGGMEATQAALAGRADLEESHVYASLQLALYANL